MKIRKLAKYYKREQSQHIFVWIQTYKTKKSGMCNEIVMSEEILCKMAV